MNSRSTARAAVSRFARAGLGMLLAALGGGASAQDLVYKATEPPLEVRFSVEGGHYSGVVHPGCLFLQTDISVAPVVRWTCAEPDAFYTLLMIDFDGNATGSWPDPVPSGENSPVRHWIAGNIPGSVLKEAGYRESETANGPAVLQAYRAPHIPMVSDRYGLYLFKQAGPITFASVDGPITNFDYQGFLKSYGLETPVASNFFVAVYTSESPFSGKPFQGNDVQKVWHQDLGKGTLTP